MLSQTDISHYHSEGLVVPDYRIPDNILNAMREDLSEFLSDHTPDFVPNLMKSGFGLKYGSIPEILDMVNQLIGNDFVLWASGMFGKPPRVGKQTPWHQDGQYWPIQPLATCTVWVALDDSTTENGCLRYIPGSHRNKILWSHEASNNGDLTLNQVLDSKYLNEDMAKDVVLKAGQISIHDVFLVHGSQANSSGKRRAGVTFRYMPTTSYYNHEYASLLHKTNQVPDISRRKLYLVRGVDKCGKNKITYDS